MSAKSTIDDFLWPNKYLLNFLGFWPMESDTSDVCRYFAYFRVVLSMFVIGTIFVPEIFTLIIYWGNISRVADVGSVTIEVGQLVFKLFYMLVRQRKFCQIYRTTKELWLVADDRKELENLEKLARLANRITITLFVMGMSNIVMFVLTAVVVSLNSYRRANSTDYARHLPLEIWYGIDTQRTPNFEVALCYQALSMAVGVIGIAGFDATMMSLILHVSGQFRLVSARFRGLGSEIELRARGWLKPKIGGYIAHHQRVTSLAQEMRGLLGPVIFVQMMSSGLEICLCGYMLAMKAEGPAEMAKYTVYSLTMFLQLVFWCWPGEMLIRDSEAVGQAVCHELPWYRLPAGQQRDLGFFIARVQKSCCVTAGFDSQVMSLRKLTEVFNAAASYFTLLRSVSDK